MKALAVAILALALLPAAAAAKTGVSVNSTPDGLAAGEPWDVQFQYIRNDEFVDPSGGARPAVVITGADGGRSLSFPAQRLHNGMWAARVVFPTAGRWTYKIRGFGRQAGRQFFDPAWIAPARRSSHPREVRAGVGGGGSFPYGWVGGAAGAVLLVAAGIAVRRRRA